MTRPTDHEINTEAAMTLTSLSQSQSQSSSMPRKRSRDFDEPNQETCPDLKSGKTSQTPVLRQSHSLPANQSQFFVPKTPSSSSYSTHHRSLASPSDGITQRSLSLEVLNEILTVGSEEWNETWNQVSFFPFLLIPSSLLFHYCPCRTVAP